MVTIQDQFVFGWFDACERYAAGEACASIEASSGFNYAGRGQRAAVSAIQGQIDFAMSVAEKVGLPGGKIDAMIRATLEV